MSNPSEKACSACRIVKAASEFRLRLKRGKRVLASRCTSCERAARMRPEARLRQNRVSRMWARNNPEKAREKYQRTRLKRYGLTPESLAKLEAVQGNRCKACGDFPSGKGTNSRLHVDHDHGSGRFRGLLCNPCNVALGMLYDDPARIAGLAAYAESVGLVPLVSRKPGAS